MQLTEESADGITIVAISGRLDAQSARQFGDRLGALIGGGRSRLVIEASGLDYIGSLGFRALLVATRLAAESQGRLVLCGLTAPVRRVVELGGFGDAFEGYATREEALAELGAVDGRTK